jgi:hypothetical protein
LLKKYSAFLEALTYVDKHSPSWIRIQQATFFSD